MGERMPAPVRAPVPGAVSRLAAGWHRVECWVAIIAFSLIGCLLIFDVGGREIVGPIARLIGVQVGSTGIVGGQKIAVYALVIGSFAGVGIATAGNSHLVPRVGFAWTPARWVPRMERIADLFTCCFLLGVAWYGFEFVMSSKMTSMRAPVLDWEVWPFQLAIPVGFVSAALRYLMFAIWPGLKPPPPEFQE